MCYSTVKVGNLDVYYMIQINLHNICEIEKHFLLRKFCEYLQLCYAIRIKFADFNNHANRCEFSLKVLRQKSCCGRNV